MKRTSLIFAVFSTLCTLPVQAQALRQANFPDGTGSVGLPAGWQLTSAYRGSVSVSGPGGAAVILGVPWVVLRPESNLTQLPAAQTTPIATPQNLALALSEVLAKRGSARLTGLRGQSLNGQALGGSAALLMYDFVQNGTAMTDLGYFAPLEYAGSDTWQLYSSAIVAPRAQFAQLAPTLMNVWKSWKPNGQAPLEGSASARLDGALCQSRGSFDALQRQFRKLL